MKIITIIVGVYNEISCYKYATFSYMPIYMLK